jgi:hypothetical protein
MNEITKAYIKECSLSIRKYRELQPEEQAWLYPLLHKSVKTAIRILEAISDRPRNYEEISKITDLNKNTIKQFIYALSESGIKIQSFSEDRVYCSIGRRKQLLFF